MVLKLDVEEAGLPAALRVTRKIPLPFVPNKMESLVTAIEIISLDVERLADVFVPGEETGKL